MTKMQKSILLAGLPPSHHVPLFLDPRRNI